MRRRTTRHARENSGAGHCTPVLLRVLPPMALHRSTWRCCGFTWQLDGLHIKRTCCGPVGVRHFQRQRHRATIYGQCSRIAGAARAAKRRLTQTVAQLLDHIFFDRRRRWSRQHPSPSHSAHIGHNMSAARTLRGGNATLHLR